MMEALIAGFFGLLIGSFLNVLILRYNTGKGFGGIHVTATVSETK